MKKLLRFIIVILLIAIVAASVALGLFYKKATPTLLIDIGEKPSSTSQQLSTIDPKFKTENEVLENRDTVTSQWWVSKWYVDMKDNPVSSVHFDLTDCDFKTYLKSLKNGEFNGFTGFASYDKKQNKAEILFTKTRSNSKIVIYGFGKTKLSGKTLEIKIEESVNNGDSELASLPVILSDYTASAADKLELDFNKPVFGAISDSDSVYHITITEADQTAAPAYENENPPEFYALSGDLEAKIKVPEDAIYSFNYLYGKCEKDAEYEVYVNGKAAKSASLKACDSAGVTSSEIELKKGEYTVQIKSDDVMPEVTKLTVMPVNDSVYLVEKSFDGATQKYVVAAKEDGEYSIASTELKSNLFVNSTEIKVNNIGGATAKLKRGFNEIEFKTQAEIELSITKSEE